MKLTPLQRKTIHAMFGGRCACCGVNLPEKGWHADHVSALIRQSKLVRVDEPNRTYKYVQTGISYSPEHDHIENLFPACRACNIDKSTLSIADWRNVLQCRADVCRRNYSAFRHAERFGLIVEVKKPVVFWFEQYKNEQQPSTKE